jgi:hypothetical protein
MQQQMRVEDEREQYIGMDYEQNRALSWHWSGRNEKSSWQEFEMRTLQPRNFNCNKTLIGSQSVTFQLRLNCDHFLLHIQIIRITTQKILENVQPYE